MKLNELAGDKKVTNSLKQVQNNAFNNDGSFLQNFYKYQKLKGFYCFITVVYSCLNISVIPAIEH